MHLLLKISLFLTMAVCSWQMIRNARTRNEARLLRATVWLRGLSWLNGALLVLWLVGLVRH
jgi:hypothetical protein